MCVFFFAFRFSFSKNFIIFACSKKYGYEKEKRHYDFHVRRDVRRGVLAALRREDAAALLGQNRNRFALENLQVVCGSAPEACVGLPAPTHAFIGGSAGNMHEIVALLLAKNPHVRIVATAVSLESVAELTDCLTAFPFAETEVVSLQAARDRKAGSYHLMSGQNPIYIFTMQGGGETA